MSSSNMPSAQGKKRTIEDVEQERGQVEAIVHNVKKQRFEYGADLPDDFLSNDQKHNPETWSEDHMKKLFAVLMEDVEAKEGLPLNVNDQQMFETQMQYLSAWTAADPIADQTEEVAESDIQKTPQSPVVNDSVVNTTLTTSQVNATTENTPPVRSNPLLSDTRPIQPTAYGRRLPGKPVFPPADVPIDGDIPLAELCAKWPNHLVGVHLRRFIRENWMPGRIFVSMHPDARKALDTEASSMKKKGWEIIQQRLEDEKKKMAEEASTQVQVRRESQKEVSPASSRRPGPVTRTLPQLPQQVSDTASRPQLVSPERPAQKDASSPLSGSSVPRHLSEHQIKVKDEVSKQSRVIHQLLQQASDWIHISVVEQNQRLKNAWLDKAQKHEAWLIEKFRIDTTDIDFSKVEKRDILDRQGKILWKTLVAIYPLSAGVTVGEGESHRDHILRKVYNKQLMILEEWTAEWEDELAELQRTSPIQKGATGANLERPQPEQPAPSTTFPPGTSVGHQSSHHHSQHHRYEAGNSESYSSSPASPHSEQPQGGANHSWQHGYAESLQPQPLSSGYGQSTTGQLPYASHSDPAQHGRSNGSLAVPGYTAYTGPNLGNVQAIKSSIAHPVSLASPAYPVASSQGKKRGAPRQRMFITMPTADTPLPPQAQFDDQLILRQYPEHLSLPEVMRRFVQQPGGRVSGWTTRQMVDILIAHPNSKDTPTISQTTKRENVRKWVVKERDTCNSKIRGKKSGTKKSIRAKSLTATS